MHQHPTGLLISDFNLLNLAALLNQGPGEPLVDVRTAPFGQVIQTLSEGGMNRPDFTVAWTQPQAVLEEVSRVLDGFPVDLPTLEEQVDVYCDLLSGYTHRTDFLIVPTWVIPVSRQGHGGQDLADSFGISRILLHANNRLLQRLSIQPNIVALNASRWMELAGGKAFNPRLWYLSKIPFANDVFSSAAKDIKATLLAIMGRSRKLVLLDLDDTLWGGVAGDVGWENVVLGGHDADGEALVDFQRELKALVRRGIILGIVSKNDQRVALEVIDRHPDMVLRRPDFAGWRINWNDKAANVAELAAELNLGLNSIVFIDDNPAERDRVRMALPDVLVPEWPSDKRLYPNALLSLDCFGNLRVTEEDRQRSSMYAQERQRSELRAEVGSVSSWLASLGMQLIVTPLEAATLTRASQLMNKTNQMNLSTRRLSEAEFIEWADREGRQVWLYRLNDKFGDSGVCGIASASLDGFKVELTDFLLSCRVMGRRVEEAMLGVVINWARQVGAKEVVAIYRPTEKNRPCFDFLARSGLTQRTDTAFAWSCLDEYPPQRHIEVRFQDAAVHSEVRP